MKNTHQKRQIVAEDPKLRNCSVLLKTAAFSGLKGAVVRGVSRTIETTRWLLDFNGDEASKMTKPPPLLIAGTIVIEHPDGSGYTIMVEGHQSNLTYRWAAHPVVNPEVRPFLILHRQQCPSDEEGD